MKTLCLWRDVRSYVVKTIEFIVIQVVNRIFPINPFDEPLLPFFIKYWRWVRSTPPVPFPNIRRVITIGRLMNQRVFVIEYILATPIFGAPAALDRRRRG